jgi:4-hydroxy-2-oxoheptanedioate aldolase
MPEYLTAQEIATYHAQGLKSIEVETMPILTDEARELAGKLGFEIKLKGSRRVGERGAARTERLAPCVKRKTFGETLRESRVLVGTFVQVGHPALAEYTGKLGFDFLIVDCEHSAINIETVQSMLQALGATPAYGVVRIPAIASQNIAAYLDMGADAILVPQVRTLEDLALIESAALYPPIGKRGIGPGRAVGYGSGLSERARDPNKDTVVIPQIETKEAIENLEAILESDFFPMVFIGPGDLSMNLGVFGEFSNPVLVNEINRIIRIAKRNGKKIGIFSLNAEGAAVWLKEGVDMVVINSDLGLMGEAMKNSLKSVDRILKRIPV